MLRFASPNMQWNVGWEGLLDYFPKHAIVLCKVFLPIFPLFPKMHIVFFLVLHSLHSVLLYVLSFGHTVKRQKTGNPPMYLVFPFHWRFLPPGGCVYLYFGVVLLWVF